MNKQKLLLSLLSLIATCGIFAADAPSLDTSAASLVDIYAQAKQFHSTKQAYIGNPSLPYSEPTNDQVKAALIIIESLNDAYKGPISSGSITYNDLIAQLTTAAFSGAPTATSEDEKKFTEAIVELHIPGIRKTLLAGRVAALAKKVGRAGAEKAKGLTRATAADPRVQAAGAALSGAAGAASSTAQSIWHSEKAERALAALSSAASHEKVTQARAAVGGWLSALGTRIAGTSNTGSGTGSSDQK